jgi:cell shape-determining protein MreC
MTYLKTHNRYELRRTKIVTGFFVAVIVIVGALQFFMPYMLPQFFTGIARPFWRMQFAIESGSLRSQEALLNENQALKREIENLKLEYQWTQFITEENEELKGLLGRKIEIHNASTTGTTTPTQQNSHAAFKVGSRTLAAVLSRPPFAPYDMLVIDGGSDLDFETGDLVYAEGDVLVGKISDVLNQTAKVTLLTSAGQRHEVLIGPSRVPAYATGIGGGQYSAELPSTSNVKEGDVVIVPSLNDRPFAIIKAILRDPAQAFETVLLSPSINLYQLRWVLVETK